MSSKVPRRNLFRFGVAAALMVGVFVIGGNTHCVPVPPNGDNGGNGNDNGPPDDPQAVTARIVNITTNFGVSAKMTTPLTVLYTVTGQPASIEGFVVPVADAGLDAQPIGQRQTVAGNLPPGSRQAFGFDPRQVEIGFYRVGVVARTGNTEVDDLSRAVIRVEGPPAPRFIQPRTVSNPACSRDQQAPDDSLIVSVARGTEVFISFDAGDPEDNARWRLFFLSATDSCQARPDLLGTQISTGSGNVGMVLFSTSDLAPNDYELGVSATDTGMSVSATAVEGQVERIVTAFGPIIRVTAP